MRFLIFALTIGLLLGSPAIAAQGKRKAKGKGKGRGNSAVSSQGASGRSSDGIAVDVDIFSTGDRELIRGHYRGPSAGLPPGLAKRGGSLPPGLEKQLQRNGRLPPGLEKRIQAFPADIERRLPRLKKGLRRGFIEGRAVIFNESTRLIVDAFTVL